MEQQKEEKNREEHGRRRKRRRRSKSTLSFPMDLTSEILLRLPVKSLLRFRCVSKLWSSIINDPYFINLFETRSSRLRLLFCSIKDGNLFVCSIPQHSKISNKSYSSSQPTDRYQMKIPGDRCYSFTESVHGLICFIGCDETPTVWNPSKRELLALPKPMRDDHICISLGYDPIEGRHKLVCLPPNKEFDVCQVLALGSAQESWRTVETNTKLGTHGRGRYIKGVIYNPACTNVSVIVSFDVRSERFRVIQLPPYSYSSIMTTYEGKLACAKKKTTSGDSSGTIKLYVLEDAETHEWSRKHFLAPLYPHFQSLGTYFGLIDITHAGEFIYAPCRFRKSSYILFCDPVRNSYRRFEFKGIADDESWVNDEWLYVFPNHTESLK